MNYKWSRRSDSNRGPAVYETAALPTELRRLEIRILVNSLSNGKPFYRTRSRTDTRSAASLDPLPDSDLIRGRNASTLVLWRNVLPEEAGLMAKSGAGMGAARA